MDPESGIHTACPVTNPWRGWYYRPCVFKKSIEQFCYFTLAILFRSCWTLYSKCYWSECVTWKVILKQSYIVFHFLYFCVLFCTLYALCTFCTFLYLHWSIYFLQQSIHPHNSQTNCYWNLIYSVWLYIWIADWYFGIFCFKKVLWYYKQEMLLKVS